MIFGEGVECMREFGFMMVGKNFGYYVFFI